MAVGQTASATITFQNQGTAPVQVSQFNVSGQFYSSSGSQTSLPLTIAANSSYSLSVQFNPGAAGALTGQLTVTSNASNGTSAAVSFSGTGVPVPSVLSCSSGAITGAGTDNCTVTLNAAAASGGLTVDLTSNSAAVTVPSTVTVAEDQTSASFTATIVTVSVAQNVAVTANVAGISQSFALRTGCGGAHLERQHEQRGIWTCECELASHAVGDGDVDRECTGDREWSHGDGGRFFSGDRQPADDLESQPDGGADGAVRSHSGGDGERFADAVDELVDSKSKTVNLSGRGMPVLAGLNCSSGSMTGAGIDNCTATLNTVAAGSGFTVGLSSNNSAVTVPSSINIPAGQTSAGFTATVSSVSTSQSVTLTASAGGSSKTFALQLGSGVPTLGVSASTVAFGNVNVNSAATQTITLSSTGTAAVTISADAVSGTGFSVSGASFPLTLNPNQTATLTVQFDPTAAGAASGSLTLTSNSSTGTSTAIASAARACRCWPG